MSRTRKTARARDAFRMNWVFGQIVPVIIDVPEIALIGVAVLLMRAMLTTYPKVVTRHIALMTVLRCGEAAYVVYLFHFICRM